MASSIRSRTVMLGIMLALFAGLTLSANFPAFFGAAGVSAVGREPLNSSFALQSGCTISDPPCSYITGNPLYTWEPFTPVTPPSPNVAAPLPPPNHSLYFGYYEVDYLNRLPA